MVEMNSIPWSPVLRYATPLPMNMTPYFDRSTPTQVRFLHFAVRHTPPNQQDPVSTVGGPFPLFCGTPHPSRSRGPPF